MADSLDAGHVLNAQLPRPRWQLARWAIALLVLGAIPPFLFGLRAAVDPLNWRRAPPMPAQVAATSRVLQDAYWRSDVAQTVPLSGANRGSLQRVRLADTRVKLNLDLAAPALGLAVFCFACVGGLNRKPWDIQVRQNGVLVNGQLIPAGEIVACKVIDDSLVLALADGEFRSRSALKPEEIALAPSGLSVDCEWNRNANRSEAEGGGRFIGRSNGFRVIGPTRASSQALDEIATTIERILLSPSARKEEKRAREAILRRHGELAQRLPARVT